MTFIADTVNFRTYDRERGLELFSDRSGPEGIEDFRILRGDGRTIRFSTAAYSSEEAQWREVDLNRGSTAIFRLVRPIRGHFSDMTPEESDSIIIDAPKAWQGFNGRPSNRDVTVVFASPVPPIQR